MRSTFKSVVSEQRRLPNIMWVGLAQSAEDFKSKDWPLRKKEFCNVNYSRVPGLPFRIASPHNHVVCSVTQLCPTLCDSMDCSPPRSSVHGIVQARILGWVAISSSRGSSQTRDQTHVFYVSYTAGRIFTHWAIREAPVSLKQPNTRINLVPLKASVDNLVFIGNDAWSLCLSSVREDRHVWPL